MINNRVIDRALAILALAMAIFSLFSVLMAMRSY